MDDSEGRETLQMLKTSFKKEDQIFYAGREEKLEFIKKLSEKGIPINVLQFLFFGLKTDLPTHGGNRNAFLLNTVGEPAFSSDDDVMCRVGKPPHIKEGLKVGFGQTRETLWFYPDRGSALKDVPTADIDILGAHESILGLSVPEASRRHKRFNGQPSVDASDLDDSWLDLMIRNHSQIVLTVNGIVGDSGMSYPDTLLYSSGDVRRRLLASEANFQMAFTGRELAKYPEQWLIFKAENIMAGVCAMDGRETLPPFFPMFRGEDGLFGNLIRRTIKGAAFGYLPYTLLHDPEGPRQYNSTLNEERRQIDLSLIPVIEAFLSELGSAPLRCSESDAFKLLGTVLANYGGMPAREFHELLVRMWLNSATQTRVSLENLLTQNPRSPKFYTKEVQKRIEHLRIKISIPVSFETPYRIDERFFPSGEGPAFIQKSVSLFGEALLWWPEILKAAKELKQNGIRLAQPL